MSVPNMINGERVLDYSMMLNTKENQILELERKIANLEAKLARSGLREKELESEISRLQTAIYSFEKPNWSKRDV